MPFPNWRYRSPAWHQEPSGYTQVPQLDAPESCREVSTQKETPGDATCQVPSSRRVGVPISIYGLAIAAPLESAFGRAHQTAIITLVILNNCIQGLLIFVMHGVSKRYLDDGEGCGPNEIVQFIGILVFTMIIWDEISATFDMVELIYHAGDEEGSCSAGEEEGYCSAGESQATGTALDESWTLCSDSEVSCEQAWALCFSARPLCSDQKELYSRQFSGFNIKSMNRFWKVVLALYVVVPKFLLEMALLIAGSTYIAVSANDEDVITSVVAVNFICNVDELFLTSLMSSRTTRTLKVTPLVEYMPLTVPGRIWVHLRTSWRAFVDPCMVVAITYFCFWRCLHEAGCWSEIQ